MEMTQQQQDTNNRMAAQMTLTTSVFENLARATEQRNYDYVFNNLPTYDGKDPNLLEEWLSKIETACKAAERYGDIRRIAESKSGGAVTDSISTMAANTPWSLIKDELRRCFGLNKTRIHDAMLTCCMTPLSV